ncbi:hypothetical protein G6F50_016132 [Rhizopus delemar]|uniref:Uncharacterized protein n=1 Tax=Rhizopus delemar TaxID=936053 RepID=A0A9P7C2D3_9FUNG|nr:hypothetical protein G6F50_016132 [Rhizopus delemar]
MATVVAPQSKPAARPMASPSSMFEDPACAGLPKNATPMPPNAIATPSHWSGRMRSSGNSQCKPSAAKMGAVYRNTDMCEAVV